MTLWGGLCQNPHIQCTNPQDVMPTSVVGFPPQFSTTCLPTGNLYDYGVFVYI